MTPRIHFAHAIDSAPRLLHLRRSISDWCARHRVGYGEYYSQGDYVVVLTEKKYLTLFMLEWTGQEFYIDTENFCPKNFLVC